MKRIYLLPIAVGLSVLGVSHTIAAGNAPNFTAVVDSNGTLARGYRAVSATQLQTGTYEVVFSASVAACDYTATVGLSGTSGSEEHGIVSVASREGKAKGIFVQTFDTHGTPSDRGFHVIVAC